jgi:tetratricopeptide (TPR) repeat protein
MNRYLGEFALAPPSRVARRLTIIAVLSGVITITTIVTAIVISERAQVHDETRAAHKRTRPDDVQAQGAELPAGLPVMVLPLLLPMIIAALMRRERKRGTVLHEAERLLARGRIDEALARAHAAARNLSHPGAALFVAGRCAERAGDFGDAAEVFDMAARSLAGTPLEAVARAEGAFSLAAAGELDRADSELDKVGDSTLARFHATRARLLTLAKRGRNAELLELASKHAALLHGGASLRDRDLVWTLVTRARQTPGDGPCSRDAVVSSWIAGALAPLAAPERT